MSGTREHLRGEDAVSLMLRLVSEWLFSTAAAVALAALRAELGGGS